MKRKTSRSEIASDVKSKDGRVRVYGTVVSVSENAEKFVLDDGTSSIDVLLNNGDLAKKFSTYRPGDQVMVIGAASSSGVEAGIIRSIKNFNPDRYRTVLEVWENVQSKNR